MSESLRTAKSVKHPPVPNRAKNLYRGIVAGITIPVAAIAVAACSTQSDKQIGANSAAHIAADASRASASAEASRSSASAEASMSSAAASVSSAAASLSSAEASRSAAATTTAATTTATTEASPSRTTASSTSSATSSSSQAPTPAPAPSRPADVTKRPDLSRSQAGQFGVIQLSNGDLALAPVVGPYADEQNDNVDPNTLASRDNGRTVTFLCRVIGDNITSGSGETSNIWDVWNDGKQLVVSPDVLVHAGPMQPCQPDESYGWTNADS